MKNITICIPTHCIKTETAGPYIGIEQKIPTAPSSKLIENIIKDLLNKTGLPIDTNIHIGLDKRKNRTIDQKYEINLGLLRSIYPNLKLVVNESETEDPIITAPQNFTKLIDSVKTKYYLFWEHDWIFLNNIDIKQIIKELDNNKEINWIRFNVFKNNNDVVNFIPIDYIEENIGKSISILRTTQWSNNPYICRTEIFQKWWKTFIYPTYEEGGFVEGPLNVFYKHYIQKQGLDKALKNFKCFIYGKWNQEPLVTHLNGYRIT